MDASDIHWIIKNNYNQPNENNSEDLEKIDLWTHKIY